jgi:hypothetical protein
MDIKKLSEKAKEFGVWINIFNRHLFKDVANNMGDDEKILFMTKGHDLKSSYKFPVVITNKAVYVTKYAMFGSLRKWVVPIDQIKDVFRTFNIFFYTVIIYIDMDSVVIGRQSKKNANKIIEILAELRNKNNPANADDQ